jgi:acetyl-CoA carboxylase biotin carboxylase subunit
VRWDGGIEIGSEVGLHYDPMLAKLIVWAPDRAQAVERMHRALLELTIHGLETSRDFHLRVMEDEEFRRGAIEIQWLERRLPELVGTTPPDNGVRAAAIAAALLAHRDRTGKIGNASNGRGAEANGGASVSSSESPNADGWKHAARREAIGERW